MTWTSYPIQLCNQVFHPFVIWWKECMWLCFLDLGSTMYVVQFHQLHVAGFFNSLPPWAKRVWSQAVMVTSVECGVLFCFCFFGHVFGAILVYLFDKAIWRGSVAITQTEKKIVSCVWLHHVEGVKMTKILWPTWTTMDRVTADVQFFLCAHFLWLQDGVKVQFSAWDFRWIPTAVLSFLVCTPLLQNMVKNDWQFCPCGHKNEFTGKPSKTMLTVCVLVCVQISEKWQFKNSSGIHQKSLKRAELHNYQKWADVFIELPWWGFQFLDYLRFDNTHKSTCQQLS